MHQYQYQISEITQPDDLLLLKLKPVGDGAVFQFLPGQYATLSFNEGQGNSFERSFSIASSPLSTDYLEFGIRKIGPFTKKLAALTVGSPVKVRGPFGTFVYDLAADYNAVLIAGGIGITPFMSMIRYHYQQRLNRKLTLIYSNRRLAETLYLTELVKISQSSQNLKLNLLLTDDPSAPTPNVIKLIQGRVSPAILKRVINPLDNTQHYFICGPSGFMDAAREQLISLGILEQNISQEEFSFAPPKIRKSDLLFYVGAFGAASFVTLTLLLGIYRVETNRTVANQSLTTVTPTKKASPSSAVQQTGQPVVIPSTHLS